MKTRGGQGFRILVFGAPAGGENHTGIARLRCIRGRLFRTLTFSAESLVQLGWEWEETGMPRARDKTARRRRPTQERSEATVDAIVSATERVLRDVGYEKLTTNRVAEVAGVSIGSLYQYFNSKDALVAAVVERGMHDFRQGMQDVLYGLAGVSMAEGTRAIVRFYFRRYREDPAWFRAVIPVLQTVKRYDKVARQTEDIVEWIQFALEEFFSDKVTRENLHLAAFMIVSAAEGIGRRAIDGHEDLLEDDLIADEFAELIVRYLTGAPSGLPPPPHAAN